MGYDDGMRRLVFPHDKSSVSRIIVPRIWTPLSATTSGGVTAAHWFSPSHANFQDSARTTAVASDGDVTGSSTDNMTAGDHLSQAVTANKPIYKTGISNGKPMWLCDGSNDILTGAFTNGGAVNQPFTLMLVSQLDATAVNDGVARAAVSGDDNTNDFNLQQEIIANPDEFSMFAGASISLGASNSNYNIFSFVLNGASSAGYINGISAGSGNAGTKAIDGMTICNYYNGAYPWKGYIGDIIVYPGAMSTADLNQVGQYLATFYGLTWTAIP